MKHKKLFFNLLKFLLTAVILFFLGRQVYLHWAVIKDFDWNIHPGFLILSVLGGFAAFVLMALAWRIIIANFGFEVTLPEAFKISYLSNLGRYVPGKVWQVFGILYLTGKKGIPVETSGASFVLWQVFTIPAAFLAFALAAQLEPSILIDQVAFLGETTSIWITVAAVIICALILFYPDPILKLVNSLLRLLSRPEVRFRMDKSVALLLFLVYFVVWIVYGMAFWLFLMAVVGSDAPGLVASIGIFSVAYQIGYLVLFAPGGFGPREAVLAALLVVFIGPTALLVAGLARLWSILIEILAALIALRIRM